MTDLGLSILSSVLIFLAFKLFPKFKVYTLYGIIVNYGTAASLGLFFYFIVDQSAWPGLEGWMLGCLFLGVMFILVFNLMARTAQEIGLGIASVATKMSLVIPVLFGILFYKENASTLQIIGIILALISVYLITAKKENSTSVKSNVLWLPVFVFLGSGVIDTSINYIRESSLTDGLFPLFSCLVFGIAALSGIIYSLSKRDVLPPFHQRDLVGGIGLGIPNYFSIFFLLRALNQDIWGSALVFTLNNVAIVVLSTLVGILLFKEQLKPVAGLGIALALISIIFLAVN